MCGRFVQKEDNPDYIKKVIADLAIGQMFPSYNIAPTQNALAIYQFEPGKPIGQYMHWGLIPSWSKDPKIGQKMINARMETLTEKPSFRAPVKRKRCVIPASGFYEWEIGRALV